MGNFIVVVLIALYFASPDHDVALWLVEFFIDYWRGSRLLPSLWAVGLSVGYETWSLSLLLWIASLDIDYWYIQVLCIPDK